MTKDNSSKTRERRAREAAERQESYDKLDAEGRLLRVAKRIGQVGTVLGAKRERARLEKLASKGL